MPPKTRPSPDVDHYAIVGVGPSADLPAIKRAYRKRSFDLHPDRNGSPEAHRQMARLNDSFAVLSDSRRREAYDAMRPRPVVFAEPPAPGAVPPEGPLAFQPDRLPDWYEFLDLRMNASSAEVIDALNRTGAAIRAAAFVATDEDRLHLQLKRAADTLTSPRVRAVYDRALAGAPRPPARIPNTTRPGTATSAPAEHRPPTASPKLSRPSRRSSAAAPASTPNSPPPGKPSATPRPAPRTTYHSNHSGGHPHCAQSNAE